MSKQVIISEDAAKLVMQCLDLAVKSGGLNAAAAILPIARDIEGQLATDAKTSEAVAALQS